jgi:hypothetical protein
VLPTNLPSSIRKAPDVSTWQQRYTEVLETLYALYERDHQAFALEGLQALTGFATEIREGLDAGLLDGDTVPTARPDCPDCDHSYAQHNELVGGCSVDTCLCANPPAVLVAIENTLANRDR